MKSLRLICFSILVSVCCLCSAAWEISYTYSGTMTKMVDGVAVGDVPLQALTGRGSSLNWRFAIVDEAVLDDTTSMEVQGTVQACLTWHGDGEMAPERVGIVETGYLAAILESWWGWDGDGAVSWDGRTGSDGLINILSGASSVYDENSVAFFAKPDQEGRVFLRTHHFSARLDAYKLMNGATPDVGDILLQYEVGVCSLDKPTAFTAEPIITNLGVDCPGSLAATVGETVRIRPNGTGNLAVQITADWSSRDELHVPYGFEILREPTGEGFPAVVAESDGKLIYTDRSVEAGKSYKYTVRASTHDGNVVSRYSKSIDVVPGSQNVEWAIMPNEDLGGAETFEDGFEWVDPGAAEALASKPGTYSIWVIAKSGDEIARKCVSVTIQDCAPLAISTDVLPSALFGVPYSAQLQAIGGVAPYTWSIQSPGIPGLAIDDDGCISGNPNLFALYVQNFTVEVTDSVGASATRVFINPIDIVASNSDLQDGSLPWMCANVMDDSAIPDLAEAPTSSLAATLDPNDEFHWPDQPDPGYFRTEAKVYMKREYIGGIQERFLNNQPPIKAISTINHGTEDVAVFFKGGVYIAQKAEKDRVLIKCLVDCKKDCLKFALGPEDWIVDLRKKYPDIIDVQKTIIEDTNLLEEGFRAFQKYTVPTRRDLAVLTVEQQRTFFMERLPAYLQARVWQRIARMTADKTLNPCKQSMTFVYKHLFSADTTDATVDGVLDISKVHWQNGTVMMNGDVTKMTLKGGIAGVFDGATEQGLMRRAPEVRSQSIANNILQSEGETPRSVKVYELTKAGSKVFRFANRTLFVVAVLASGYEIYNAQDHWFATTKVVGGWAGALAGAWAAGEAAALIGAPIDVGSGGAATPFHAGVVVLAGLIGGGIGAVVGRNTTAWIYKTVVKKAPTPTFDQWWQSLGND